MEAYRGRPVRISEDEVLAARMGVNAILQARLADNGATRPNCGGLMMPALYDSGSNRTYHAWEAWINDQRSQVSLLSSKRLRLP